MKGIRFYEELNNKNRKAEESIGNVVAVLHETGHFTGGYTTTLADGKQAKVPLSWCYECVSALFFEPNSVACSGSASQDYLTTMCRRVSEARARKIHPRLFERLD